jgi:acyl dehydratase
VALRDTTVAAALQPRSVHASHHLVLHRPPRAGDVLHTSARITQASPRRAGTLVVARFETVDADGRTVSVTDYGSVYRGVALRGAGLSAGAPPARPAADQTPTWQERVDVPATAALVYTECARIWNPIHTDLAVARGAGLSSPILHGTATLALAVSRVVERELAGEPRVREIRARFTGMVPLPSAFTVRGGGRDGDAIRFDAVGPDNQPILSQGVLIPCDR